MRLGAAPVLAGAADSHIVLVIDLEVIENGEGKI